MRFPWPSARRCGSWRHGSFTTPGSSEPSGGTKHNRPAAPPAKLLVAVPASTPNLTAIFPGLATGNAARSLGMSGSSSYPGFLLSGVRASAHLPPFHVASLATGKVVVTHTPGGSLIEQLLLPVLPPPTAQVIKTGFDINVVTTQANEFLTVFFGRLRVTTEGDYTFVTNTDDVSTLYIDGTQVVPDSGVQPVNLVEGSHEIMVVYQQMDGTAALTVESSGPDTGGATGPIDPSRLTTAGSFCSDVTPKCGDRRAKNFCHEDGTCDPFTGDCSEIVKP
eukprot:gene5266-5314_t